MIQIYLLGLLALLCLAFVAGVLLSSRVIKLERNAKIDAQLEVNRIRNQLSKLKAKL